jgi:hypothetical protein
MRRGSLYLEFKSKSSAHIRQAGVLKGSQKDDFRNPIRCQQDQENAGDLRPALSRCCAIPRLKKISHLA